MKADNDEQRISKLKNYFEKRDDVDLLILNRTAASMADSAIRGIPLAIKDQSLRLKFARIVSGAAEEYRYFVDDYYKIVQRSN